MVQYQEEVVEIDEQGVMVGIACCPTTVGSRLAVIFVNGGMLHRVGPCRNTVLSARFLAKEGVFSLRFDYFGIGDSKSDGRQSLVNSNSRNAEIRSVLDYVERKYKYHRFIVHGLCSGAGDAFQAALHDERIVGIGQIDGYSYRNLYFYINKILPNLLKIESWLNAIGARVSSSASSDESRVDMMPVEWSEYPPKPLVAKNYQFLADRGMKFLVVYTGSWRDHYNYENQFFDMFPGKTLMDKTSLLFMPESNHLMSDRICLEKFLNKFMGFIKEVDSVC
jgi:hypothetical protein